MCIHLRTASDIHQAMENMNWNFTSLATQEQQKNLHLKQSIVYIAHGKAQGVIGLPL
jgi:hypothetical protein